MFKGWLTRRKQRRNQGLSLSKLVWFGLIILIFLSLVWLIGVFLKVKKVQVLNQSAVCFDNQAAQSLSAHPDLAELAKVKSKYLCVDKVVIEKKFPNSLLIRVIGRRSAARVKVMPYQAVNLLDTESTLSASVSAGLKLDDFGVEELPASSSAQLLTDESGVIFGVSDNQNNLPLVNLLTNRQLEVGSKIEGGSIKQVLIVLDGLKNLSVDVKEIRMYKDKYLLITSDQKILFNIKKDLNRQIASLQLILHMSKINPRGIEKIDLRFDKPVVVYSSKNG